MITTRAITDGVDEGQGAQQIPWLARRAVPALQLGGLCWMGMYGLEVVVGLATGQSLGPAHLSAVARVDSVALLGGGMGLSGIGDRASRQRDAHPAPSRPAHHRSTIA